MSNKKAKKTTSYGIVGLGRFGMELAIQLAARGHEVLAVDTNEEHIQVMRQYTEHAFILRSLDRKSLEETGIQNCDVGVVCIGEKIDVSILVTLYLTNLGVPRVIAKASSNEHGEILRKLGADVVYPERDMADRVARRLDPSRIMDYMEINEAIDISKIEVPDGFVGRTILELNIRQKFGGNVIAIEQDGVITTEIHPEYRFQEDDILFVIGDHTKIAQLEGAAV